MVNNSAIRNPTAFCLFISPCEYLNTAKKNIVKKYTKHPSNTKGINKSPTERLSGLVRPRKHISKHPDIKAKPSNLRIFIRFIIQLYELTCNNMRKLKKPSLVAGLILVAKGGRTALYLDYLAPCHPLALTDRSSMLEASSERYFLFLFYLNST